MKTRWMVALSVGVAAAAVVPSAAGAIPSSTGVAGSPGAPGNASNAGPPEGLVHPRDDAHAGGGGGSSPLMTYHSGKIMTTANIYPIFWGTSWKAYPGDEKSGIDTFYRGISGSNYAKTADEYTGQGAQVGPVTTAVASVEDDTAAAGGGSTSAILAEVQKEIAATAVPLDSSGNGYYPVYTDLPRGHAGYCAWHSYGQVSGVTVQIAFFWKLDGDAGCDPQSSVPGQSEGLAASANVSAHEVSEARSDPASPGAWYDGQGNENGDKCAWTFGAPSVTLTNGTSWKLQGEWSNNAYTAGNGYPNSSGQKGCLSGL